jgi:hypothetical protein
MPISNELGIISNLEALFVLAESLLRDPNRLAFATGLDDICHCLLMMISTGAAVSVLRS